MVTLIMTIVLLVNIYIAVKNWEMEIDFIKLAWTQKLGLPTVMLGVSYFVLDSVLTSGAAALFGIGTGVIGAAATMTMSNLISFTFLIPKAEHMLMVKEYQREKKLKEKMGMKGGQYARW